MSDKLSRKNLKKHLSIYLSICLSIYLSIYLDKNSYYMSITVQTIDSVLDEVTPSQVRPTRNGKIHFNWPESIDTDPKI